MSHEPEVQKRGPITSLKKFLKRVQKTDAESEESKDTLSSSSSSQSQRLQHVRNDRVDAKLAAVNAQAEGLKVQMRQNMDKAVENSEKVSELDAKSVKLEDKAKAFRKNTKDLKRKMFWKNVKTAIVAVTTTAVLAGAVVAGIAL